MQITKCIKPSIRSIPTDSAGTLPDMGSGSLKPNMGRGGVRTDAEDAHLVKRVELIKKRVPSQPTERAPAAVESWSSVI